MNEKLALFPPANLTSSSIAPTAYRKSEEVPRCPHHVLMKEKPRRLQCHSVCVAVVAANLFPGTWLILYFHRTRHRGDNDSRYLYEFQHRQPPPTGVTTPPFPNPVISYNVNQIYSDFLPCNGCASLSITFSMVPCSTLLPLASVESPIVLLELSKANKLS